MSVRTDVDREAVLVSARAQVLGDLLNDLADALECPTTTNKERAGLLDEAGVMSTVGLVRRIRDCTHRLAISSARLAELVDLVLDGPADIS